MSILNQWLKKHNVSSFLDLNDEEKKTYREWENVLSGKKLTDEDVKVFFDTEIEETINLLTSTKLNKDNDNFLKVKLEMLRKLKGLLLGPEMQAKALEDSIKQQLK